MWNAWRLKYMRIQLKGDLIYVRGVYTSRACAQAIRALNTGAWGSQIPDRLWVRVFRSTLGSPSKERLTRSLGTSRLSNNTRPPWPLAKGQPLFSPLYEGCGVILTRNINLLWRLTMPRASSHTTMVSRAAFQDETGNPGRLGIGWPTKG